MARLQPSPAFAQYVDDELLRAPLLFEQVAEGAVEQLRRGLPTQGAAERSATSDLIQAIGTHRAGLAQVFTRTLREMAAADRERQQANPALQPKVRKTLALVEEDEVTIDVELSHITEAIKSTAEHELRELNTFVAALVGDLDVATDNNPFRPESYARALWATSQTVPLSRGHQMRFMRVAALPLAHMLRQSYASACSRLESMGVEPAAYRTVIMGKGSRRSAGPETTYTPDLYRMRETMPAPLDSGGPLRYEGQQSGSERREHWTDIARDVGNLPDRQAIELVSRLFEAIATDDRVPQDIVLLLSRLHGPAMRLTRRDATVLDQDHHPLWRFVHLLAYEAEMVPDPADPERRRLLRLGQQLIDQLAADPDQRPAIYRRAVQQVEDFLRQRLQRRCATTASQIGAMQKLEHQLLDGDHGPDTLGGMADLSVMDLPAMDTVPADILDDAAAAPPDTAGKSWLASLEVGTWVRLYLQGRWLHAQLLWVGDRGEVWLFGDGSSDATWAVRRGALLRLHAASLAKTLTMRSLLGRAAQRVQDQINASLKAGSPAR